MGKVPGGLRGWGGQFGTNQRLDLAPDRRVALNLHVRLGKPAIPEGIALALHRVHAVVVRVVAENLGVRGVGSADLLAAL